MTGMTRFTRPRRSTLVALLMLSLGVRLIPFLLLRFDVPIDPGQAFYPWNFSPLLPIGLFGAACYADRRLAFVVPLACYLLGDLGILLITGRPDWAFYGHQPVVYLSVAMVVTSGLLLRTDRSAARVAGAGLLASTAFFLISNFGVWAFGAGTRFPLTSAGLIECYIMGLPYYRNTLISMVVFLPILFSRVSLQAAIPRAGQLAPQRG
jgi:hypothetical protein